MDMETAKNSKETNDNSQGTTTIEYTSRSASELESQRTSAHEKYRRRRDSETDEQRDERNKKRREKYNERVVAANYHTAVCTASEVEYQRTAANERYRKRRDSETNEQRDERNKKRREKYKEQVVAANYRSAICTGNQSNLDFLASNLIVRPTLQFTDLPLLSKNMRTRINNKKRKFALSNEILDIGCADKICCNCGALMWRFEQTEQQRRLNSDKFSLCCGNGKVRLPLLRETPPELKSLLDKSNDKSMEFYKSIRMYNYAFAFTSVGADMDKTINNGGGPFVCRIHGVIYHNMGSLFPEESKKPVFSQLYMYDYQQQFEERSNFPNGPVKLDAEITNSLSVMLHRENALVHNYRQLKDRFRDSDVIPAKIRLVANRETDGRESNIPPNAFEFAGLVANDNLTDGRDIVIQTKGGGFHRVSVLHPCYMSLQYPLLFPRGEDGYRTDILHAGLTVKSNNKRDVVSIREYYCYRIHYRHMEGHTLIGGGRLFLQFVIDAWASIEHTRLTWVVLNQTILRSDLYNNVVDSVNRGDTDATKIGTRIVLPSSFTGSPRYMQQNYQDCMAICRRYGSPDLFITFTCNPKWTEIKEFCDKIPHSSPSDRPDVLARVFKIKLDLLLEDLTDNHVLGKVIAGEGSTLTRDVGGDFSHSSPS